MEERLEQSSVQQIQIPSASIVWYEKGKEIIVDGKLFDVKSMKVVDGLAFISGLFDEEETDIKNKIDKLRKQQQSENGNTFYSKLIELIYFKEDIFHTELSPVTIKPKHSTHWAFTFLQQSIDISSPPPEI